MITMEMVLTRLYVVIETLKVLEDELRELPTTAPVVNQLHDIQDNVETIRKEVLFMCTTDKGVNHD